MTLARNTSDTEDKTSRLDRQPHGTRHECRIARASDRGVHEYAIATEFHRDREARAPALTTSPGLGCLRRVPCSSTATYRVHDLDAITRSEDMLVVAALRVDRAVDFYGHASVGVTRFSWQCGDADVLGDLQQFAIQ